MELKRLQSKLTGKLRGVLAKMPSALFIGKKAPLTAPSNGDGPALQVAFSDPTHISMPNAESRGDEKSTPPLRMLLEKSADNIQMHARDLKNQTNWLVASIGARAGGEITLATQTLRFIIGGIWLLTAVWLYLSAAGALSGSGSVLSSGMTASDAMTLSKTFLPIGIAGIGVAMAVAALIAATGNGANDKVRREAHALGLFIADTAREFDDDLTHLRNRMDNHIHNHPENAVRDLSYAHLIALEAAAYFNQLSFLTGSEGEDADDSFKKFLKPPSSKGSMIEGFILGALISAIITAFLVGPKPELPEVSALPDIAKYPWAANLLLYGGILYALAGLILSLAGNVISAGAVIRAREDALASLRGAFTSREAPRLADVIQRIEDAEAVFRARVGGRGPGTARSAHSGRNDQSADQDNGDADSPAWRHRDSSAQFVESGFQAAPQTWRADAYAKKFHASDHEKTGSKRGLLGLKKPPRD